MIWVLKLNLVRLQYYLWIEIFPTMQPPRCFIWNTPNALFVLVIENEYKIILGGILTNSYTVRTIQCIQYNNNINSCLRMNIRNCESPLEKSVKTWIKILNSNDLFVKKIIYHINLVGMTYGRDQIYFAFWIITKWLWPNLDFSSSFTLYMLFGPSILASNSITGPFLVTPWFIANFLHLYVLCIM